MLDLRSAGERGDVFGDEIEHLVEPLPQGERGSGERFDKGGADPITLGVPFVLLGDGAAHAVKSCVKRAIAVKRADETTEQRGYGNGVIEARAAVGNAQL